MPTKPDRLSVVCLFCISALVACGCQPAVTPTVTLALSPTGTPSPTPIAQIVVSLQAITAVPPPLLTPSVPDSSECDNPYFPSDDGTTWEYAGNNSATGTYHRTDTITDSRDDGFSLTTQLTKVTYTVEYHCTDEGLVALDAAQPFLAAMFTGPDDTVTVKTLSNSGVTLPAEIQQGDSWQQVVEWQAANSKVASSGRFTFDYTAVGLETISVPAGTFDAIRIDVAIEMEIGGTARLFGTYTNSMWLAENVGLIKSEGISQIPGVPFTDSLELESYDSP